MKIVYSQTPEELGKKTAKHAADLLRQYIEKKGRARLLLSTGASQFTTFNALINEKLDWKKIEMFHLDEYIGLPQNHPASFIKYLQTRFVDKVQLGAVHYVDTSGDIGEMMAKLTAEVRKAPIDVGLIGIGENAHIAFNDPPADFDSEEAFIIVNLDEACRNQQFGEGWFPSLNDVPAQAVTMTVREILKCEHIISAVPYEVKAQAIYDMLTAEAITSMIPATILKTHNNYSLYLDKGSASMVDIK